VPASNPEHLYLSVGRIAESTQTMHNGSRSRALYAAQVDDTPADVLQDSAMPTVERLDDMCVPQELLKPFTCGVPVTASFGGIPH